MKFPHIKVGIRNENLSSIRFYKYKHAKVLEANKDSFHLKTGWFSKVNGRKGVNIVTNIEEKNANFYLECRANRLQNEIKQKLEYGG